MESVVVIRYSEIGLKGKNRKNFEEQLIKNIKKTLNVEVEKRYSRILIKNDLDDYSLSSIKRIFGVQNFSPGFSVPHDFEKVKEASKILVEKKIKESAKTFKVNAKRAFKKFKMGVYDINKELGAYILKNFPSLKVDVHNPDFILGVEIREKEILVFADKIKAYGGLPVGISGKGILLLSGGIDSPVAGWYALKRGVLVVPVTFMTPPFTSERSLDKVIRIVKILSKYSGGNPLVLNVINMTNVQMAIRNKSPDKYRLILYRRSMFRIAEKIAFEENARAIYTGENVGQVASQTLDNMWSIESVTSLPVIRPLSGFDKIEIIDKAKEIGTYEISILPYQDSCVFFAPKNPATKSEPKIMEEIEKTIENLEELEEEAFRNRKKIEVINDEVVEKD